MPQRKKYPPYDNKKPQKFIPRRDLFPEDDYVLPNKLTPVKKGPKKMQTKQTDKDINQQNIKQQYKSDNINFLMNLPVPVIFLVGVVIYALWSKGKNNMVVKEIKTSVNEVLDNQNYVDMLRSIGPYLGDYEQDIVYTTIGILEAATLIKDILNHTYQSKIQSMSRKIPKDPVAKKIEMMKVLKPYLPETNRRVLDNVIKVFDTADRLNHNIEMYRSNYLLADNRKLSPIDNISEIVKIIKPIIPEPYAEKADKIITTIKMAEVLSSTDASRNNNKKNKSPVKDSGHMENPQKSMDKEQKPQPGTEQLVDTLKSMLPEEQKQSVDVIMKMAQMLAQPSDEDNP